ncbi:MAG: YbaB/EbfC family nucleoid-associated protein [Alphaproteobacteria bacterium]|nr:YbaB/EbfC family nucleoid-associated protein [Alphaproteobacteria bacterium]
MKNLGQMLKQAQAMQSRMGEMQAELERMEIAGVAGGDLVKVVLSGKCDLKSIKIDASLMVTSELEVLEDLIVAAHRDARAKLEAQMSEAMSKITGGIELPAGMKFPFG